MKYKIRKYQWGEKIPKIYLDSSGNPISEHQNKRNQYEQALGNSKVSQILSRFVANTADYNDRLNQDAITAKHGTFKKQDLGSIDLPATHVNKGVDPNSQFMYPHLSGDAQRVVTNFSKEVIGSALPIPFLQRMGKLPSILGAAKRGLSNSKYLFKPSQINWGSWNSEIPHIPGRVREYNWIEKSSKIKGNWMKNPDGTTYQGLPEQFIQERSKRFKKMFPEGYDKTFRGNRVLSETYLDVPDKAVFGASDKSVAENYTKWQVNKEVENPFIHPNTFKHPKVMSIKEFPISANPDNTHLTELLTPKSKNTIILNAKGKPWTLLENRNYLDQNQVISNMDNVRWNSMNHVDPISQRIYTEALNKGKTFASTDNYASYIMSNENAPGKVIIKNVIDGGIEPTTVSIINPNKTKIKSRWFNNGNFDPNNPNIFK